MKTISNQEFGGERPLFGSHNLQLKSVTIHAGESALKNCRDIVAIDCRFEGKYPFWHVNGFKIDRCMFTPGARAALWYSKNLEMNDTVVDAPKMFREMDGISLTNVKLNDAQETLWHCANVKLRDVEIKNADYLFMHSRNIDIDNYRQEGNYSFQYCDNVVIRNSVIHSKDAFWNTRNVTIYDSEISGEYLGWHSQRLTLVRCRISGTQPLCYAKDLRLIDCSFDPDCDLAFEDSELDATVITPITSVKNPASGRITAPSIGETIIDEFIKQPADCIINTTNV